MLVTILVIVLILALLGGGYGYRSGNNVPNFVRSGAAQ
jgi:hypothetical protein